MAKKIFRKFSSQKLGQFKNVLYLCGIIKITHMKNRVPTHLDKPTTTILSSIESPRLEILFNAYKKDPSKAKVLFTQAKSAFTIHRTVLFEWENGDFKVAKFIRKFGISKTNIMYHRETPIFTLMYKKDKLYKIGKMIGIKQASWFDCKYFDGNDDPLIYDILLKKFNWLRNLGDDERLHHIGLGVIFKNKLFSNKALLRHIYKVPYPVIDIVTKDNKSWGLLNDWKLMRPYLINIEGLTSELFTSPYFSDSVAMAEALGKKINCSWSVNRLKTQHNKWTKEIVEVILDYEPLRDLNNHQIFVDFEKFSGYELLKTNHDLIYEGKRMSHCVGTYSETVDAGISGIFRVNGYTLQLTYRHGNRDYKQLGGKVLTMAQFMDFRNTPVSLEHMLAVEAMIDSFTNNDTLIDYNIDDLYRQELVKRIKTNDVWGVDMPF